ncbi:MAG: hypothetical protein AAFY59_07120 [Pseudomonadota bacterium]
MTNLQMPPARDYGWDLKPDASSHFQIHQRENGQFCVVLNHALLRGVTAEMIQWWFLTFPNLKVRLIDIPGYEGKVVPAYLLWHPSDHYNATLSGNLGPDNTPRPGAKLLVQEAMQYEKYGWRYPVNSQLTVFYVGKDGWAMGRAVPLLGPLMMLRIHFRDVFEGGTCIGAHYHYEIVIGLSGRNPLAAVINKRISAKFGPEFFAAWHRHNVIEVGVFENFLPPLYAQRGRGSPLEYRRSMDPKPATPVPQTGHDRGLFERRIAGFQSATNPFAFQGYDKPSFL